MQLWCFSSQFIPGIPDNVGESLYIAYVSQAAAMSCKEQEFLLSQRHVFNGNLYSLQQESFVNAGFQLTTNHLVVLPSDLEVLVLLGCADRYMILERSVPTRMYATINDWRRSDDYPFPDALPEWRRIHEGLLRHVH